MVTLQPVSQTWSLLLLTVFYLTGATAFLFVGKMTPNDPEVKNVGDTLVLTCSMPENYLNMSSDRMFFTVTSDPETDPQVINRSLITIVNSSTIQLTIPHVDREFHKEFFYCKVNTSSNSHLIAAQTVDVYTDPEPPRVTCMVHHRVMNCSWEPHHLQQQSDLILNIKDTFKWRLAGETSWRLCWDQRPGYCVLAGSNFTVDAEYDVVVNATTKYTYSPSNVTRIKSRDIVKLPVISKIVLEKSRTSVRLKWPPPIQTRDDIKYKIIYNLINNTVKGDTKPKEEWVSSSEFEITGLVPNLAYAVSLRSIVVAGVYLSDPIYVDFTMDPEVPLSNPSVTSGSFSIRNIDAMGCREISIFWKKIPEIEKQGPGFQYIVSESLPGYSLALSDSHTLDSSPCNSRQRSDSQQRISVPKQAALTIMVKSQNKIGISRGLITPVTIPANTDLIAPAKNFTTIYSSSKSSVDLSWNNATNNTTVTYHVYWCLRGKDLCKDEISWKTLSSDVNSYTVKKLMYDYDQYMFGISRETDWTSSGILWSECIFEDTEYSLPPTWMADQIISENHGELTVQWDTPQCHVHRGYVYGYVLTYCPTEAENCSPDDDEETIQTVEVPKTYSTFAITGLDAFTRYCVTIRSLTAKGPSPQPSEPVCATVSGNWMTTGVMAGFIVGGIVLLIVLVFCIIKFSRYCRRVYYKFKTGVHVEMPNTYNAQTSVSSQKGLVDEDEKYFMNEFSMGLAKQNSQESTADSGRGSLSQDHIRTNLHRVSSGDLDDVFPAPNGTNNGRSEPMSGYARVTHASGGSNASQATKDRSTSLPRPRVPNRNMSPTQNGVRNREDNSGHMSSHGNNAMPSYVMVDEGQFPGGKAKSSSMGSGLSSIPMSDYVKAQDKSGDYDFHPHDFSSEDCLDGPSMTGKIKAQGDNACIGYVTVPELDKLRPGGNVQPPSGYVQAPDPRPRNVHHNSGYITVPPTSHNPGLSPDYIQVPHNNNTVPNKLQSGNPSPNPCPANDNIGYVTVPPVKPSPGQDPGYVLVPPPNNTSHNRQDKVPISTDYVTLPGQSQPADPLTIANKHPKHGDTQPYPGYVPNTLAGADLRRKQQAPIATPDNGGYITLPNIEENTAESATQKRPKPGTNSMGPLNSNGYITLPPNQFTPGDGEATPPLDASTPQPHMMEAPNVNPYISFPSQVNDNSRSRGLVNQGGIAATTDQPYITLPNATPDEPRTNYVLGRDTRVQNDANHNSVSPYTTPGLSLDGHGKETSRFVASHEEEEGGEEEEEEEGHLLLPSNGGRKVLNKSGYLVINP